MDLAALRELPAVSIDKKNHGVFYTPHEVTQILAQWAVRDAADYVLEPSFGGCGFLRSLVERLKALRADSPEERLYGCDVDPEAFVHLARLLGGREFDGRFLQRDFLRVLPGDLVAEGFNVVIGNPPYVSYHNMVESQREALDDVFFSSGCSLSRKASLWAYFVLHSLQFLRRGGRVAWILPGSFLHADYAQAVRTQMQQSFRRILAVLIQERLFVSAGTEERTVVVLADGYLDSADGGDMRLLHVSGLVGLQAAIAAWEHGESVGFSYSDKRSQFLLLDTEQQDVFARVGSASPVKVLESIADLRIGIVTGNNKFFIINREQARTANLPSSALTPIVRKFADLNGVAVREADTTLMAEAYVLVDTRQANALEGPIKDYLSVYPRENLIRNRTFEKRAVWHQCHDGRTPDGFFPCMLSAGPYLVLNFTGVTCTNTVYRVFFKTGVDQSERQLAAISILSTFSQLSAEIEGRSYGSGALKLEPSEAGRLHLLWPVDIDAQAIASAYEKVDRYMRQGNRDAAQGLADELVLSVIPASERNAVLSTLRAALAEARGRRLRK